MNLYKCPGCSSFIDLKYVNERRRENKGWLTKFKCHYCGIALKQTWLGKLYAWFAFAFMGYVALFEGGDWYYYALIPFAVLIIFARLGLIYLPDK
jgi:hypothetical protein